MRYDIHETRTRSKFAQSSERTTMDRTARLVCVVCALVCALLVVSALAHSLANSFAQTVARL